ncbi:hypothetical protein CDL15_Pgr022424 [Punica granatum]|uniref:Uncharacterized protein n=1 Tax=Punica granatum TaxID=22663 RepID=A0A218XQR5_PUNGR|nr:hypothetical protein CDL15_Pgr022424 [Punica granatum]
MAVVAALSTLFRLYNSTWKSSERLRKRLNMQGIGGPPPSLLYGNVPEMQRIQTRAALDDKASACSRQRGGGEFVAHDYTSTLFPYFEQWRKEYVFGSFDTGPFLDKMEKEDQ